MAKYLGFRNSMSGDVDHYFFFLPNISLTLQDKLLAFQCGWLNVTWGWLFDVTNKKNRQFNFCLLPLISAQIPVKDREIVIFYFSWLFWFVSRQVSRDKIVDNDNDDKFI